VNRDCQGIVIRPLKSDPQKVPAGGVFHCGKTEHIDWE
jgi:hypothetical protein